MAKGRHRGSLQLPVTDCFAFDMAPLGNKKKKSQLSIPCFFKKPKTTSITHHSILLLLHSTKCISR